MTNEPTKPEDENTLEEKYKKKIDLQKLAPKKIKFKNIQVKQKYAFTRVGKTKIG